MKQSLTNLVIIGTTQILCASPSDYIPQAPPSDKPIAEYSVGDVVGAAFTRQESLPAGHPLKNETGVKAIKANWPGASQPEKIDVMLAYVIQAQSPAEERDVAEGINWAVHELTVVSRKEIADSFLRLYAAHTQKEDKRKVAFMAKLLFPYVLDARLLTPLKDMLDDPSVFESITTEGRDESTIRRSITVRMTARNIIRSILLKKPLTDDGLSSNNPLMSDADKAAIFGDSVTEESSCNLLKAWLSNHWQDIENQVEAARTNPARTYPLPRRKFLAASGQSSPSVDP